MLTLLYVSYSGPPTSHAASALQPAIKMHKNRSMEGAGNRVVALGTLGCRCLPSILLVWYKVHYHQASVEDLVPCCPAFFRHGAASDLPQH